MIGREAILDRIKDIPSLPAAAIEVAMLVQDPNVSIKRVSSAIEYDPGLTTNVLHLANSVYFGGRGNIRTVKDAIVRLGTINVYHLVIGSAVAPIAQQEISGYELKKGSLWRHSVAVALGAREIARELRLKVPEYTFTAGLLHDIGKLVLGTFMEKKDGEKIKKVAFEDRLSFEQAEFRILGIDHTEVGAEILRFWNLPKELTEVVRWHHNPDGFEGDSMVVDLVHMSDALCISSGLGTGCDELNYRTSNDAASRIGMNSRLAEITISRIIDTLDSVIEVFSSPNKG
jgi:putative nucleotidyltransferase with HDIG domain